MDSYNTDQTQLKGETKSYDAEANGTKLDRIVLESPNNITQDEEIKGETEHITMLLSNDAKAVDLNKQSQNGTKKAVIDEALLQKRLTMPLLTSPSLGTQEFSIAPISPRSTTTTSMSASDDLVDRENETLRERVVELERRLHDQNDEVTCLRATLADALRRISSLEAGKGNREVRLRASAISDSPSGPHNLNSSGGNLARRPVSGTLSSPLATHLNHGRDHLLHQRHVGSSPSRIVMPMATASRRPVGSAVYQSTGSLHSDGHSSNSMSPAPSPSPTQALAQSTMKATKISSHHQKIISPTQYATRALLPQRPLSGSLSNLNLSTSRKWNSTSDFREQSQLLNIRRQQAGSLHSLRSPFGSQQNISEHTNHRHGTKDATYNDDEGILRIYIHGRPIHLYLPTALMKSGEYSVDRASSIPAQRPKIEWVYGYRGKDARLNLHLLPTGEMVYFVAAVIVLFNADEHAQRHYLGHTGEIKCLTIHPNRLLIASGQTFGHNGREGKAHVRIWNSVSLQTIHILGLSDLVKHVVCLSFSKADGGNLLLTVDEGTDHTLSIWDWSRSDRGVKITETKCSTETVVAAEFHPLEAGSIVSIGKGHVNFWQLDPTLLTLSRKTGLFDVRDKPKYVTCLAFSYTGDLLTGDSNGNLFVWGKGYNAVTKALRKIHDGPIFSICVLKDGGVITGGGRDRKLVQLDASYKRSGVEAELPEHIGSVRTISQGKGSQLLLGTTRNSILQGTFELSFHEIITSHVDDVWAIAAHPHQSQFLSAGYDHHIHLWDTLSHRAIWSSSLGDHAQSACFSPSGDVIVVAMTSGKWMVLDSQTREVYGVFQDGHDPISTSKFAPNGKFLALGSRDGIIYVYQVSEDSKKFTRMGRCLGHSSPVTHLDWSSDSNFIQSNSREYELLFWNASICRPMANASALRDTEWATQTCIIGFNTMGVWPETYEGMDIRVCARSNNNNLLVTGDELGHIRLFSSPPIHLKSLYHCVGGHGSNVTNIDFISDDMRFISAGGHDSALIQWTLF